MTEIETSAQKIRVFDKKIILETSKYPLPRAVPDAETKKDLRFNVSP